ncbi:MAG TPA: hypothetical protein VK892_22185, partial [Pyrinomonadaceae bacterium]|nr:hypothetical protein [Pyrinomonadaceae bacterium]
QQEKPLNFNDILSRFTSDSGINDSIKEINEKLIADISKRKVNFILNSEDKKSLKKAGASSLLIKTIDENLPETLREKIVLYKKYLDNYEGNLSQMKKALKAAREYVERFSDDEENKTIINYLNESIPILERIVSQNLVCNL